MENLVAQINAAGVRQERGELVERATQTALLPAFVHCGLHMQFVETTVLKGEKKLPGPEWICCQSCEFATSVRDVRSSRDETRPPADYRPDSASRLTFWQRVWGRWCQSAIEGT